MSKTDEMLKKIYATQIVLLRKIRKMEEKAKGTMSSDSYSRDLRELDKETEKVMKYLNEER
ncbi:hypothetical protein C900_00227 [Fulvivirga imtechensis AK7]|uniref:Uncharacterized protein n=1 Tax=Fulvivirga imtechensis AK7 TaxID=1237149 RepID=L8JM23_9BACT|nr:hypothetical protein [Fulvivirga imtechensis]ELR68579.1 hypothetical protein C900_00227 [Fulvivirga imtechensis AK7]